MSGWQRWETRGYGAGERRTTRRNEAAAAARARADWDDVRSRNMRHEEWMQETSTHMMLAKFLAEKQEAVTDEALAETVAECDAVFKHADEAIEKAAAAQQNMLAVRARMAAASSSASVLGGETRAWEEEVARMDAIFARAATTRAWEDEVAEGVPAEVEEGAARASLKRETLGAVCSSDAFSSGDVKREQDDHARGSVGALAVEPADAAKRVKFTKKDKKLREALRQHMDCE